METSAPNAGVQQRPGGCVPFPSALWHGMVLLRRDPPDPEDGATPSVVAWVDVLLQEAAREPLNCPRCGRSGTLSETLRHLLADHGAGFGESAEWLESIDPDLYALAVHYLASKSRAEGTPTT